MKDVPLEWKILWLEKRVSSLRACQSVNHQFSTPKAALQSDRELQTAQAILQDYEAQRIEKGLKGRRRANG
ncbi:hypothetical protein GCM10011499_39070 [Pelagibacterium lentulum]|uniref:Uncharacterized protein n=1 Tax=Pelagibacterium lentulum TaxID=2029865 RepID=A0A916W3N8_9HYPH|nr:hypothetical protein GCM10011499_39070 [Pelagibacterium lentulum]